MSDEEYTRIVNLFIDDVQRMAYACCRNLNDAEDITQTVFMKLHLYKKEFDSDEHVKRWLIRVAVNESRSLLRSPWKKRVTLDIQERAALSAPQKGDAGNEVLTAINLLGRKYREIVFLHYFEEYSTKEMAEILGISQSTVLKRLQRAREKLKELLSDGKEN